MAKENVPRTIMNKDKNKENNKADNVKQYKKCSKEEEDKILQLE